MTASIEVIDTGEVAGVAYIHGIGKCLHTGLRMIFSGLEILVEDVVGIVGGDKATERQTHGVTEQTAASVIYGTDVVFVFDPANASNRPPQIPWYDQQQERWDRLPEWMKKVFTEAFTEPSENRWIQAVQALGQAADDA